MLRASGGRESNALRAGCARVVMGVVGWGEVVVVRVRRMAGASKPGWVQLGRKCCGWRSLSLPGLMSSRDPRAKHVRPPPTAEALRAAGITKNTGNPARFCARRKWQERIAHPGFCLASQSLRHRSRPRCRRVRLFLAVFVQQVRTTQLEPGQGGVELGRHPHAGVGGIDSRFLRVPSQQQASNPKTPASARLLSLPPMISRSR